VVLDATVFYPQGGGQPADTGAITGAGAKFLVEDVRAKDGVVRIQGPSVSFSGRRAAHLFRRFCSRSSEFYMP
jgi:Ser-tRNA(Ala) deacylase AlaX